MQNEKKNPFDKQIMGKRYSQIIEKTLEIYNVY